MSGSLPLAEESGEDALAEAYSFLQKVVAVIAFLLPPVVAVGDWVIDGRALRGSISHYYYGRTGGWFVGSLCALAVFLLTYEYRRRDEYDADRLLSNAAFVAALGVALFPTTSDAATADSGAKVVGTIHLLCAAALFVMLAIFSLYQFTKTGGEARATASWGDRVKRCVRTEPEHLGRMSEEKKRRNRIYRICGWIIVACIVMVGVSNLAGWKLLFWLEAIAVWAFGVSWLVKSGWLPVLRDSD